MTRWPQWSPTQKAGTIGGVRLLEPTARLVSMESGLEDRNNTEAVVFFPYGEESLNGVRPRRPEQWVSPINLRLPGVWSQWSPA